MTVYNARGFAGSWYAFFLSPLSVYRMVRPRASPQNLSIALEFGKMIIVRMEGSDVHKHENIVHISCNGNRAIFAAFAASFPDLVRDSRDKQPRNRQGVAAIELNKALQVVIFAFEIVSLALLSDISTLSPQVAGLKAVRKQEKVDGIDGARWRPKVMKFHAKWKSHVMCR